MPATCVPWPLMSLLGDRDRRLGAGAVGGERGVDVRLQPHGAAVVVGQLGVEVGALVHVVENRCDTRSAVGVAQVGVAKVDAGVDEGDERAAAVETGFEARGGGADGGAGRIEQRVKQAALFDRDHVRQGQQAAQVVGGGAQVGEVARERPGVEAGLPKTSGPARHPHRHQGAAVGRAGAERIGAELAGSDEPDASDHGRGRQDLGRPGDQGEDINEGERTAHLEATRHGMLSDARCVRWSSG